MNELIRKVIVEQPRLHQAYKIYFFEVILAIYFQAILLSVLCGQFLPSKLDHSVADKWQDSILGGNKLMKINQQKHILQSTVENEQSFLT